MTDVERPLWWSDELGAWRITGWDLAVRVLRDPLTFTVDDPRFSTARVVGPSMLSRDGEEHARHRAPFAPPFRPRQITSRFGTFVTAETERLLDRMASGGRAADLRPSLANPLATAVIAEALGLDGTDAGTVDALAGWYRAIVESVAGASTGLDPTAAGDDAFAALHAVVLAHLHDSDHPSVLGGAAETLDDDEVVSNAAVIMFGGIETTEGMILNLVWHLLTEPGQRQVVAADPAAIAAGVEESLRLEPAAAVVDRYAIEEVVLGGRTIGAGDMVTVSIRDANRDPTEFPDPDRFDVARPNARRHLAFAQGPHVCVGMDLARLEARTAVSALLTRFPALDLDPHSGPVEPTGDVFRKPSSLRVVW